MTLVIAHRGAHEHDRENTLAAFRAALALGCDGVELDVRRTADGHLVVHHDAAAEGREIAGARRADLPGYVPDLAAALDVLAPLEVNVEIKNSPADELAYDPTGALAAATLEVIADHRPARVSVSSFDLATCRVVACAAPEIPVHWLVWGGNLLGHLEAAHDAGLAGVNPYFTDVDRAGVDRAKELGLALHVWTVNDERDLAAQFDLGVDAVITDRPALALSLRAAPDGA